MYRSFWFISFIERNLLSFLLTVFQKESLGFNIDLSSYVEYSKNHSMFGYSLAFYTGNKECLEPNTLLIGAPYSLNSSIENKHKGEVFICGIENINCKPILIEGTSLQSFGATVVTNHENNKYMICAPTYLKKHGHDTNNSKTKTVHPTRTPYVFGACYISKKSKLERIMPSFNMYLNEKNISLNYENYGSSEAGFSAALSKNNNDIIIGAPGFDDGQGQAYSLQKNIIKKPHATVNNSEEGGYMGYSMTTIPSLEIEDVAIGIPRYNITGRVAINDLNMRNLYNIDGRQFGEYFGYALATLDVNGDKLNDLIISAPLYSKSINEYDMGRVYILLQRKSVMPDKNILRWRSELIHITGYKAKSRFGAALANLKDINDDGYEDFAVSAPYDGLNDRGIVYIFHGSSNEPSIKPSQIIKPEDILGINEYPRAFGIALAGGVDMDDNSYNDLAVSAYKSRKVYIFKTRPIVKMNSTIFFSNKTMDLNKKKCQIKDNQSVVCTELTTCWTYSGKNLSSSLDFEVYWVLDFKKRNNPRLFFFNGNNHTKRSTLTLLKDLESCETHKVYMMNDIRDLHSAFEVKCTYSLINVSKKLHRNMGPPNPILQPKTEVQTKLHVDKGCKNVDCVPDLCLKIRTLEKYTEGSQEIINVEVQISNKKEDAYETMFYMIVPEELLFKKIQVDEHVKYTYECKFLQNILRCNIGNPFRSQSFIQFNILLEQSSKSSDVYHLYMETNSTDKESTKTLFDNFKNQTIQIEKDVNIRIFSDPEIIKINTINWKSYLDSKTSVELGPKLNQTLKIHNNGITTINAMILFIHYPFKTVDGDILMYLSNQWMYNIKCSSLTVNNERNLHINRNLEKEIAENYTLSYLEEHEQNGLEEFKINWSVLPENSICSIHQCRTFVCLKRNFVKNKIVELKLEWQLAARNLEYITTNSTLKLSPIIDVYMFPHNNITHYLYEALLEVQILPTELIVWQLVVAAIVGTLIFLVICYMLFKYRFFQRTRPQNFLKPEKSLLRVAEFNPSTKL